MQFKALVEKQSGCQMKTLMTDRGGEFIYKPFLDYCKVNGIQRQLTVRHTPLQNGVAEKKNRTIEEMKRRMLKGKGLPNKFWAETVKTATYILNRFSTKVVRNQTPFEAWHKRKPNVSHLKVFESIDYALIPSQSRDKLTRVGRSYRIIKNTIMFADNREKNKELGARWKEQKEKTQNLIIKYKEQRAELSCWLLPSQVFYLYKKRKNRI